jgi:hypothetical protein
MLWFKEMWLGVKLTQGRLVMVNLISLTGWTSAQEISETHLWCLWGCFQRGLTKANIQPGLVELGIKGEKGECQLQQALSLLPGHHGVSFSAIPYCAVVEWNLWNPEQKKSFLLLNSFSQVFGHSDKKNLTNTWRFRSEVASTSNEWLQQQQHTLAQLSVQRSWRTGHWC